MSRELKEALDILEKEKSISKDTLLEAIEQSLIQACKNHFGKADIQSFPWRDRRCLDYCSHSIQQCYDSHGRGICKCPFDDFAAGRMDHYGCQYRYDHHRTAGGTECQ